MNHAAFRLTGLIGVTLLLAGCASVPETRYFTLDAGDHRASAPEKTLGVHRVSVPDYLDDDRIRVRPEAHRVEALPYVRWAERIPRAMTRILQRHFGAMSGADRSGYLTVDIHRFEAVWGETDRVVLVAYWRLEQGTGRACPVQLQEPLADRDPATLVAAKAQLVAALADRMENQLAEGHPGC